MIWLLSIVLTVSSFSAAKSRKKAAASSLRTSLTKVDSSTPAGDSKKTVYILKQWHLGPKTETKGFKEKYPHEKNQTAIYKDLVNRVKAGKLQVVVAEGCEGEINKDFKTAFNGWDYDSLNKIAQTKNYERIITMVPLKVEARMTDKVLTICGDNEKLIQEGNLRLSNLRGWVGFWTRLRETYPDDKGKLYADAAAELLKVPKTTPMPDLIKQVQAKIKEELAAFKKSLNDRNDSIVKSLQAAEYESAAVVIGGLHTDDLKEKVQAAGLACEVLEPPGYPKEDEKLIQDFEKIIGTSL